MHKNDNNTSTTQQKRDWLSLFKNNDYKDPSLNNGKINWVFIGACSLIAIMFAYPMLLLVEYLIDLFTDDAYAPRGYRSGARGHWKGINSHSHLIGASRGR